MTGNWNWGHFGMSVLGGAIVGGLSWGALPASIGMGYVSSVVAGGFISGLMPSANFTIGDWGFSISPAIAFGNASGAGVSVGISYSDGNWSFSGGVGVMSYGNYNGFGKNSLEVRKSILAAWDDGKGGISLGTNFWSGDFKQQTGMLGLRHGDWNVMYENDGSIGFLGDGGDSYRTAALNLSYGDYSVGFNLFTGYRDLEYENENLVGGYKGFDCPTCQDSFGRNLPRGSVYETGEKYRLGALTIGYKGYRAGVNSEKVRHAIQNHAVHNLKFGFIDKRQRMFENQSWNWNSYGQYKTSNIFTSW